MIQPYELTLDLPMEIAGGVITTTTKVWEVLTASRDGNLQKVKDMVRDCPGFLYAQYNYTPPIHFAVREGHIELVRYLLSEGALDPTYRIYPFLDNLVTIAQDREYDDIVALLQQYLADPSLCKYEGDNGRIEYRRNALQQEFQKAVDKDDIGRVEQLLQVHPEFALDKTFFWGEGILMFPAKVYHRPMIDLLMQYGARVPDISKWVQFYYFERYDAATYLMEKGMNPDHMSWHHVTVLHDMAQKGEIQKAALLIKYGADINPVEEEYQSTPLGMAARWGHSEMVEFLLKQGADIHKSGAPWSTPLVWARKKGHRHIEQLLLNAGAS